jgi:hypothetical protein
LRVDDQELDAPILGPSTSLANAGSNEGVGDDNGDGYNEGEDEGGDNEDNEDKDEEGDGGDDECDKEGGKSDDGPDNGDNRDRWDVAVFSGFRDDLGLAPCERFLCSYSVTRRDFTYGIAGT